MRVLQVIDTLEAGGAEQMAVNYANALQNRIEQSFLCCTRNEGVLKGKINNTVNYCFLNKSSPFDFTAYQKLKKYITYHKIDIVHAHSSSYFLVVLIKVIAGLNFKIVWHDHYGNSDFLENRPGALLRFFSKYFNGIISCNAKLGDWSERKLKSPNIKVIRNFLPSKGNEKDQSIFLKGSKEDFRFICVANLRPQKDHLTLINAFEDLDLENVSLHLIGKDFKDTYSLKVLNRMQESTKRDKIFYYGSQENVNYLLSQADAGVLSSRSEGLPLALLEYGLAGLMVIATDVGECQKVLGNNGILVPPSSPESLTDAMRNIISDANFKQKAKSFQEKVQQEYSESANITEILKFYQSI